MNARISLLGRAPRPAATKSVQSAIDEPALIAVERHLLACMIHDGSLVDALPPFAAVDLQGAGHYDVYEAIAALASEASQSLCLLTVAASLEVAGKPSSTALDLKDIVVDSTQAATQAELVLKASRRRQIAAASAALASDPDDQKLGAALDLAREMTIGTKEVMTSADAVVDFRIRLDRRLSGEDPAVSTGLVDLDKVLAGGLRGGQVIVLAARPGEGKSALAQGIAEHVASDDSGKAALFISLEMLAHEIMERRIASASRGLVPLEALRSGALSDEQLAEVQRLMPVLSASRMEFLASASEDIDGIVSTVKARAKKGDIGLVVMDYLQLIESGSGSADNREQQVAKVCRRIKKLAMVLQVPILLLSQLNREGERGNVRRRPRMSDLRESGSIEQDADVILFIHDEAPDETAAVENRTKLVIVEKQRAGRSKVDVPVLWLGAECRFASLAKSSYVPSSIQNADHEPVDSTSNAVANFIRVQQLAAASHGETAGIPADVIAEVEAIRVATESLQSAGSPFSSF